jgi:hypothetical protein
MLADGRVVLGVGDDCALLQPAPGMQLAISTDMLVAGRHFFPDVDPRTLGHKAKARGVGSMPWPWRRTSSSSSASRSRRKALLTAGCVKDRLRAARVRLRSAMTSSNTRSKFKSRVRKEAGINGFMRKISVMYHRYE